MSERQWTNEQKDAISALGQSLLVSAAAGSGKTSVLAERCVHLICHPQQPCSIRDLLVVTFTEAAAAEMKKRITERLLQRSTDPACSDADRHRLGNELMFVEQANISTLHSFCLRLIRQNFHRLDIDPAARVIDEDESTLLRNETITALFAERYEADDTAFTQLLEAYGDGRDDKLMELVLQTHALMNSLVDPRQWRERALQRIEQGGELPLDQSELGQEFLLGLENNLAALVRMAHSAADQMPDDFSGYQTHLCEIAEQLEDWESRLSAGYDAFAADVCNTEFSKAPSYPKDTPGKDAAKKIVDRIKDAIKEFRDSLIFSADEWRAGLRAILPHAQTFLSLVEDFADRYAKRKRELSGLDFADQERFALNLLCIREVADRCHQQFKHVLVDEYQDINAVQEAILSTVAQADNQFCVGDVKQSIYGFRLAEPGKFLEKSRDFGAGKLGRRIDLNANFRSRAPLLEAINGIFTCLMSEVAAEIEYDSSHRLNAAAQYAAPSEKGFSGTPIEFHLLEKQERGESVEDDLDRTEREALFVARRIQQMIKDKRQVCPTPASEPRDIRHGDIAVLLRTVSRKSDYFADALREHGIPVHTSKGSGFFESTEIRDMVALLQLLDNQRQDVPLASLLRSPIGNIDADGLARIRLSHPQMPFHRAAIAYTEAHDDPLSRKLKDFFAHVAEWRRLAQRRPLAEVVWKILTQTGYLTFCAGLPDGDQRQANLLHFHHRCQQYGKFGHGLYRFLQFLQKLQEEQDTARPAVADANDNAVQILSIHAAKGLEFPVVFVPDLGKSHRLTDSYGSILAHRHAYLGLAVPDEIKQIRYPSLAQILVRQRQKREILAEELRLLYVAVTRAKEHLIFLGSGDLSCFENWQSFAENCSRMPPEQFLSGRTMLDWLGPAACAVNHSAPGTFEMAAHSLTDMAAWQNESTNHEQFTARQKQFAELQPITVSPDPKAAQIISRLSYRYPQAHLTQLAAVRSVTMISKTGQPLPIANEEIESARSSYADSPLRPPSWLAQSVHPQALEIGSATHRVLQYLDFTQKITAAELNKQIDSLIARRLMPPEEKPAVQIDSILWLMTTEIGQLLAAHPRRILRELPIYFACSPSHFDDAIQNEDPADQVMLRGRLDAAIETDDGLILIDYKTDRVEPERIAQCAMPYERQLNFYRSALERISGKKIAEAYLVFLTPRMVHAVKMIYHGERGERLENAANDAVL